MVTNIKLLTVLHGQHKYTDIVIVHSYTKADSLKLGSVLDVIVGMIQDQASVTWASIIVAQ